MTIHPRQITIIKVKTIYPCGLTNHHHLTEAVAQQCVKRQSDFVRQGRSRRPPAAQKRAEYQAVFRAIMGGATYKQVAQQYGISVERTRQRVAKVLRFTRHRQYHLYDVPGYHKPVIAESTKELREHALYFQAVLDRFKDTLPLFYEEQRSLYGHTSAH